MDSFSIETEEKANLFLILCNALESFDPPSWCSPAPARVVIVIVLLSALSGAVQYSTVQYCTVLYCTVILSPLSEAAALFSLSTAAWRLILALLKIWLSRIVGKGKDSGVKMKSG